MKDTDLYVVAESAEERPVGDVAEMVLANLAIVYGVSPDYAKAILERAAQMLSGVAPFGDYAPEFEALHRRARELEAKRLG